MDFDNIKNTFDNNNDIKEEIECRNCGGNIPKENMDFENDVATCPFCGTSCRIHDSITKHYTKTNVYINHNVPYESGELGKQVHIVNKHDYTSNQHFFRFIYIFMAVIFLLFITGFIVISSIFDRAFDDYEKSLTTTTTVDANAVVDINPFDATAIDHISVDFLGVNGEGFAVINMPAKFSMLTYTLDKSSNLSNGDQITITLTNTEAYPEYNFTKVTGTATVNGLVNMME